MDCLVLVQPILIKKAQICYSSAQTRTLHKIDTKLYIYSTMGQKEMKARCEHDALNIIRTVIPKHVCTKPKGRPNDSKPMDPDLLNRYFIKIGAAAEDQPLFDTNRHYKICYKLQVDISKKMGKVDLEQFDEQLRVEAEEEEHR